MVKRLLIALAALLFSASVFGQMPVPANQLRLAPSGCVGVGTFSFLNFSVATSGVGGAFITGSPPRAVVVGDLVVVFTTWDATGSHTGTIDDGLGNTYTATPAGRLGPSSNNQYLEIFYSVVSNSGSANPTLNPSTSTGSLGIYAGIFRATGGTISFDKEVYNAPGGASATPTSTALTPTCSNSLLVGGMEGNGSISVGSGWTAIGTFPDFVAAEYQIQTTAVSAAATFNQSSGNYGAGLVIFKTQ